MLELRAEGCLFRLDPKPPRTGDAAGMSEGNPKLLDGGSIYLGCKADLECQGDFVSTFIARITHIVTPVIPLLDLLTKSL